MQVVQRQYSKVTKGKDVKSEGSLINGPNQNWEQYLVPAPFTVEILAKVLEISTERDFSLESKPPKGGFKMIRQPSSFRACLVQVAGDGYKAFQEAHTSMDNIRLRCHKMPDSFTEALKILFHGSPADVEMMLHIPLDAIEQDANWCKQLAENVAEKFDDVQDLLQELLEVCAANKGFYEDELMNAQIREKRNAIKKQRYENQITEQKKMYDELTEARRTAEKKFLQAQESIPSGWEVMGMNFVDGLLKKINGATASAIQSAGLDDSDSEEGAQETKKQAPNPREPGMLDLITTAAKTLSVPEGLKEMFILEKDAETGKKERKFNVKDGTDKALKHCLEEITEVKEAAEAAEPTSKKNLDLKRKATEVATECVAYIETLQGSIENMAEAFDPVESYDALLKIWSGSAVVENMAQSMNNEPTLGTSGPNAKRSKLKMTSRSQAKQAGQIAVENAKLKVENAKQYLTQTRDLFTKAQENYNETQDKMNEVLAELAEATAKKIDFEDIKRVLNMGIRALGELREQWAKLVKFFSMVKNLISVTLNDTVKSFLEYTRIGETNRIGGMTLGKMHQDLIYNNAFQAMKIAYNIENISGAYVDISSKHLLHRMAGLPKIIGYDAATEKDKIKAVVREISDGCQAAQQQIKMEMANHKRLFESSASRRISKIKKALDDTLPDPQPEVLKAIENAGKESKKELAWDENLDDDDNDDFLVDLDDL